MENTQVNQKSCLCSKKMTETALYVLENHTGDLNSVCITSSALFFYQVVLWLYYYYHVASSVILIWNPVNRQYVTKPQTWKEYFSLLFSLIYNQPSVALRAKMLLLSWMLKGHWDQANTKNKTSGIHWVSWVFFNNSGEMPFHLFSLQLSWIQELSWI